MGSHATKSSSGCGCGGSAATTAPVTTCDCSCGGAGCGLCQNQGYVRPRFFPGQLLTEEDLRLLEAYVVDKNRLHNRSMFGDGVVCGLEVTCHPCGGGIVTVRPGYALDCCGNDIVVPCPQELDINAMIRELRVRQLGYDCGDPCLEPARLRCPPDDDGDPRRSVHASHMAEHGTAVAGSPEAAAPVAGSRWTPRPQVPREYCLYVYYCESQTDPVSPYAPGEPCAPTACEPSRIREGFRFELRCREPDAPVDDMWSRILACFGDLAQTERVAGDAVVLETVAQRTRKAHIAAVNQPVMTFTAEERVRWARAVATLSPLIGPPPGVAVDADTDADRPPEDDDRLAKEPRIDLTAVEAADTLQEVAGGLVRLALVSADDREALAADPELPILIRRATQTVAEASPHIRTMVERDLTGLEQKVRLGQIEISRELVGLPPEEGGPPFRERPPTGEPPPSAPPGGGVPPAPPPHRTVEARHFVYGSLYSTRTRGPLSSAMTDLREDLLDRIDKSPHLTDCALRGEVWALRTNVPPLDDDPTGASVAVFVDSALRLVGVLLRYLIDCVCAALLPPCRTCDDPGVLLACLEVQDCEVTKICNLDRTFVLNWQSMRHWIPLLRQIGDAFEYVCCVVPGMIEDVSDQLSARWRALIASAVSTARSLAARDTTTANLVSGVSQAVVPQATQLGGVLGRLGETALIRLTGDERPVAATARVPGAVLEDVYAVKDALVHPEVTEPLDSRIELKIGDALAAARIDPERLASLEAELAAEKKRSKSLEDKLARDRKQMKAFVARLEKLEEGA